MFFQGWGNALHLLSKYWWYDNSVHITLPMSLAPILYIGWAIARYTSRRLPTRVEKRVLASPPAAAQRR